MENTGVLECAVCLQTCIHPAQLPCGHIFCFLCVKGVANQSKRCAMCRQEIPCDFLENPKLVTATADETDSLDDAEEEGFQWFYEGRNGWWKYDIRTNKELDAAFQSGVRSCELLIAGFLYIIDFDSMLQLRRNDPSRRRRIKRDSVTIAVKGVAGIKSVEEGVKTPEPETEVRASSSPPLDQVTLTQSLDRTIQQICSLTLQDAMGIVADNRANSSNNGADDSQDTSPET